MSARAGGGRAQAGGKANEIRFTNDEIRAWHHEGHACPSRAWEGIRRTEAHHRGKEDGEVTAIHLGGQEAGQQGRDPGDGV